MEIKKKISGKNPGKPWFLESLTILKNVFYEQMTGTHQCGINQSTKMPVSSGTGIFSISVQQFIYGSNTWSIT
jgi:hypothetical protein